MLFIAVLLALASCARQDRRAPATGFNLLLVTIDTVRADHLGVYGYAKAETPVLDRLAGEGVRFARASSPVPLTLPAHASILSGLLPPRHGVHNNGAERFPDAPATLATDLAAVGYRTGAFIGAFVLDHRFGLARGFEVYDDDIDINSQRAAGLDAERPGRVVVDRAVAWLAAPSDKTKPFFAWVHLYDAHAPYQPPEPYRSRFTDAPYDGEIAEVDHQVGRLLAELDRLGVASRTVVAVAGDHGEALGEHGELTHGLLLYEPSLHVPVILRAPGALPTGWVVETPVSLADLAPTLAGLLGKPLAPAAGGALDGRDLSAELRERREPAATDLFAESRYAEIFGWSPLAALRRGSLKYIAAPKAELYDLERDPGETDNLLARGSARSGELAGRLAGFTATGKEAGATRLDAEARAKLASLGYISGPSRVAAGRAPRDPKDMVGLYQAFDKAHWALVGGRFLEARAALEKLVAADPDNPVFVGQLAEACRSGGDLERAIALYRKAVALAPDDRDARYNLAITLQEAGHQDEALTALTAAIWLDPGRPEAHNALGIALAVKGDLEGARAQFAKAAELEPRNARTQNNLANVLRDLRRFDEAEQAYRKAAELAPDYPDPWNGLGTLEVQRRRPVAALPCFEKALALAPRLHEARLNRAIAEELAGDRRAAIAAYKDFLSHAANDPQFAAQRQAARRLLARLEARTPGS